MRVVHLLGAIVALSLYGCATHLYESQYSAKSIAAWVVDAETHQPLEGVTVLASWEVEAGEMVARSKIFRIKLLEAVTDKNGRFYLPAWGPEPNPSTFGYIRFSDPLLLFFKPGYDYEARANIVLSEPRSGPERVSDWQGKTITLRKPLSDAEYVERFGRLRDDLDLIFMSHQEPCNWTHTPKMLSAVSAEERRLREMGVTNFLSIVSSLRTSEDDFARRGCGSVNAFLDKLSK